MIACDHCDQLIDSDDDPGCFIPAPTCIPYDKNLEQVLCEPCREAAWDRQQERAMENAP
jgi:hypothetical protein